MSWDVLPDFKGNVISSNLQVCSPRPCSQKLHVKSNLYIKCICTSTILFYLKEMMS